MEVLQPSRCPAWKKGQPQPVEALALIMRASLTKRRGGGAQREYATGVTCHESHVCRAAALYLGRKTQISQRTTLPVLQPELQSDGRGSCHIMVSR